MKIPVRIFYKGGGGPSAQSVARKQVELEEISGARIERETATENAALRGDKKDSLSSAIKRRNKSSLRGALRGRDDDSGLSRKLGK